MEPPSKFRKTIGSGCKFNELFDGSALKKLRSKTQRVPVDMIFFNKSVPYHGKLGGRNVHHGTILPLGEKAFAETHRTNNKLVGVLVGITDYGGVGVHHAIGMVKHGRTLYVCDPNGSDSVQKGMVNVIVGGLAVHYNCRNIVVYNGPRLQKQKSCVGYSSNFIQTLLKYFKGGGKDISQPYFNTEVYRTLKLDPRNVMFKGSEQNILKALEKGPVGPRQTGVLGGGSSKSTQLNVNRAPLTVKNLTSKFNSMSLKSSRKRKR